MKSTPERYLSMLGNQIANSNSFNIRTTKLRMIFGSIIILHKEMHFLRYHFLKITNDISIIASFGCGCCRRVRDHHKRSRESRLVPLRVVVFKVFGTSPGIVSLGSRKAGGGFRPVNLFSLRKYAIRIFATTTAAATSREALFLFAGDNGTTPHIPKTLYLTRCRTNSGIKFRCHLLKCE